MKQLQYHKHATCTLFNSFSFLSDIPFHYCKKGCWLYRGSSNRSGRLTLLSDSSCLRISVLVSTDFPVKQTLGFELEVVLLIPHLVLFIHSITMLPVCLIEDLISTKQSYSHLAGKEDDFCSLIFERENCSQRISDNGNSIQHLTFFVLRDTQCYLHLENHQPPKNRLRLGVAGKVRLSQNKLLPYNLHKKAKKSTLLECQCI